MSARAGRVSPAWARVVRSDYCFRFCFSARFACPVCHSVVYGTGEVMPGLINIYAGSLDDSARFKPTMAIFVRERPPWDDVSRNLTCFETLPGG